MDREQNVERYPQIYYPEVYLIEGGYKNFFEQCGDRCEPQNYVEMKDKRFCQDYKDVCKELKKGGFKRTRSLTFSFGSNKPKIDHNLL
jgi:M-phase inducer tyrosine phosphatase